MKIQTPIIHIDGSHYCILIITDIALCMNKPGRIFINLHTGLQQRNIVGPGQTEYQRFVRNSRCDNPHIDPPLCSKRNCQLHLIVHDQIRRENITVMLCLAENSDINIFCHCLII